MIRFDFVVFFSCLPCSYRGIYVRVSRCECVEIGFLLYVSQKRVKKPVSRRIKHGARKKKKFLYGGARTEKKSRMTNVFGG